MTYRREIDGLRAVAVIPVILFHAGFAAFGGGYVGVDVFFVISGYLITSIIVSEKSAGKFSIVRFYERRARRILPALSVVTLACLPFAWFWLPPKDLTDFAKSLVAVTLFASNVHFWRESNYFDTSTEMKPFLHTWSLSVEEQFYLLFPGLVAVLWGWGKKRTSVTIAGIGVVSFVVALWTNTPYPAAAFYLLPARAWELMIGALVALSTGVQEFSLQLRKREALSLLGLLLVLFSIFAYGRETPFPSQYTLAPTIGTALIVAFGTNDTWVGKMLGHRVLVGIGLISYSAYLWHQPLFAFARHRILNTPSPTTMGTLSCSALVLAFLTWKYVETPFRSKQFWTRGQVFGASAAMGAVFICLGMVGYVKEGFPGRYPAQLRALTNTNMELFERNVRFCWDRIADAPDIKSGCKIGAPDGPPQFALLGDSHAGSFVASLDATARTASIPGVGYTFRSCPPLKNVSPAVLTGEERTCLQFRDSFFEGLGRDTVVPHTIIMNARWAFLSEMTRFDNHEGGVEPGAEWIWKLESEPNDYPVRMGQVFVDSIQAVLRSGRKVILVYPVPEAGWDVPSRLTKIYATAGHLAPDDGSTSYSVFQNRNRTAIQALDSLGEQSNLVRVRPDKLLCDNYMKDRCVVHLDRVPLYFDNNHLSEAGANLIVTEIMKHLEE